MRIALWQEQEIPFQQSNRRMAGHVTPAASARNQVVFNHVLCARHDFADDLPLTAVLLTPRAN